MAERFEVPGDRHASSDPTRAGHFRGSPVASSFLRCDDGRVRWGRFGAAGVLFVLDRADGPEMLLQLRSAMAHEGGTWSCPGGAIEAGESTLAAALREATEEVGAPPEPWKLLGEHVFAPAGDWQYTTAVIQVHHRFGSSVNFETTDVRWCTSDEVERLPLHPGFATAWPNLRTIVATQTRS